MRTVVVIALAVACLGCREVQPVAPPEPVVSGYRFQGSVTSANGVPLDAVEVRLWYNFVRTDFVPIDTTRPVVTDPTKIVDMWVGTPSGEFVRQLVLDYRPPGPVPRVQWDLRDNAGNLVPSGEYIVTTAFDTVVVKRERRIAHGLPSATTDAFGRFSFGNERLPVGRAYDIFSIANQYIGTFTVTNAIDIELHKDPLSGAAQITLLQDRLTTASLTLQ